MDLFFRFSGGGVHAGAGRACLQIHVMNACAVACGRGRARGRRKSRVVGARVRQSGHDYRESGVQPSHDSSASGAEARVMAAHQLRRVA